MNSGLTLLLPTLLRSLHEDARICQAPRLSRCRPHSSLIRFGWPTDMYVCLAFRVPPIRLARRSAWRDSLEKAQPASMASRWDSRPPGLRFFRRARTLYRPGFPSRVYWPTSACRSYSQPESRHPLGIPDSPPGSDRGMSRLRRTAVLKNGSTEVHLVLNWYCTVLAVA